MTAETINTEHMAAKWAENLDRLREAQAAYREYSDATEGLRKLEYDFRARHGLASVN